MEIALQLAEEAYYHNEVPVGAVIVYDGEIIGRGRNRMVELESSLAHAEILSIKDAEENNKHLLNKSTIYITLEPCPMCYGAIIISKIKHIIYSTEDSVLGCCGSVIDLSSIGRFPHQPLITSGILKEKSKELLKSFFHRIRSGEE